MKKIILLCLLIVSYCFSVKAQNAGVAFLKLGTDASTVAMGDANASATEGAFATYWNPAGLGKNVPNVVGITQRLWFGDVRTYAAATRLASSEKSGWGFAVTAVTTGDLFSRTEPGEPSGIFGAQFSNISVGYGRSFGNLKIGVLGKYITERIENYTSKGYGIDAGMQLDLAEKSVQLGATVRNMGKMDSFNVEASTLPTIVQGGITLYPFRVFTYLDNKDLLNTTFRAEVSRNIVDEVTQFHLGASTEVFELLTLRGGYISNDDSRRFSLGAGIHVSPVQFDYTYIPFSNNIGSSGHLLTLLYEW